MILLLFVAQANDESASVKSANSHMPVKEVTEAKSAAVENSTEDEDGEDDKDIAPIVPVKLTNTHANNSSTSASARTTHSAGPKPVASASGPAVQGSADAPGMRLQSCFRPSQNKTLFFKEKEKPLTLIPIINQTLINQ